MKKILLLAIASLAISAPALANENQVGVIDDVIGDLLDRGGNRGGDHGGRDGDWDRGGRGDRDGRGGRDGDWDRDNGRDGHGGDRDRDRGQYGRCLVSFEQCRFEVFGNCVKWKNRSIQVSRRDARAGCYIAERQYGEIRRCRVTCER